ncbi:MAG: hypothetical protein AABX07_03675 [Nanoarchaeota archaeon]
MEQNLNFELLKKVKQKKELRGLADEVILESLKNYFKKNKISKKLSEKDKKTITAEIRAELRQYTGRFQNISKAREELIEGREENILKTHASTKERIDFYPEIIKILDKLEAKSILDLGCGINPLAIAKRGIYYALDIKKDELDLIKEFFARRGIAGKTILFDVRKIKEIELPVVDVCLIFKVFDILEKRGHKLAEEIIENIKCRYFLISFSTKTLSGKPMNHPQRGWIERLLTRKGFKFKQIKFKNEIFYLAEKN